MDHFILNDTCESQKYTAEGTPVSSKPIQRDRASHGAKLIRQLDDAWEENSQQRANFISVKDRKGTYIEFQGAENYELVTKSLENMQQGIRLLNVREDIHTNSGKIQSATVFIPDGKENYFNKKIQAYLDDEKNKPLAESIETVKLAVISSFWIGDVNDIPNTTPVWCEFWLRTTYSAEKAEAERFYSICDTYGMEHKDRCIIFPEKAVTMVRTSRNDIQKLIDASANIAEIRRAPEMADFYTEMSAYEAEDWIKNLKERLSINSDGAYVCILDTGVNSGHPLLECVLKPNYIQTIDDAWGTDDRDGHGTNMAGVCEYFDLETVLTSASPVEINHSLESVKILKDANTGKEPEMYGLVTSDAASLAEIANPNVKRVYCMAVTADEYSSKDGSPSSWSGELDDIICGVGDGIKKLFVVSAGNVSLDELKVVTYPSANQNHSVENPGQSWNAITVGAYTDKILIDDSNFDEWNPLSEAGGLSPFSSTSLTWDDKWPIKPDILMEGGNAISDGVNVDICDNVSILTTYKKSFSNRYFTTINATSAATAQAAYMAAELMSRYPDLWEETIRALMIHSAEWTEQMKKQFCQDEKKTKGIRELLRCCGYGIANLERAEESYENSVNMIIQERIQPYTKAKGSKYEMNEMHIHELPWPTDLLQTLGNTEVKMKVTLSYYIEAAPDQKGWDNRYRYASSALRFGVIDKTQSKTDFIKRINVNARESGKKDDKGAGKPNSGRWYLGKNNRDVGSIHSDTWTGPAVDLAECKYIAIYPVIGWWRERHNLGRVNDSMRYALVVSLSTPEQEVDFYTPIQTIIEEKVAEAVRV